MVDVFSQKKRSEIMKKIGPKNSAPERYIRSLVHRMGYRFRLHRKDLPGKPDMVFPKYRKVIFVHGCFWHGHKGCKKSKLPETNTTFWKEKISKNIKRDYSNYNDLKSLGWDYLVLWQCQIKKKKIEYLEKKIVSFLTESVNTSITL